jgi:hypothetical protein
MSSLNVKQPEKSDTAKTDTAKSDLAKRMLQDLSDPAPKTEFRPRPAPTAPAAPVVRSVEPAREPVSHEQVDNSELPEVRESREPAREVATRDIARRETRRKSAVSTVQRKFDIEVSTGQGTRHLTLRVPKDLAGDLSMMAMKNKLEENGQPTTINDLGILALRRLLSEAA